MRRFGLTSIGASTALAALLWCGLPAHAAPLAPRPTAPAQSKSTVEALVLRGLEQFEDQRYEESTQTLSAALLRPDATLEERVEVFRLLAYNYIVMNRGDEADAAVRGLYALSPEFELPKRESPRFREFFQKTREAWEAEGRPGLRQGDAAAPPPVKITHAPTLSVEPGTVVKVDGSIDDEGGLVHGVTLHFRGGGSEKFIRKSLVYSMGRFRGQIPQTAVQPPAVEYYLLAIDEGGLPLASRGDADAPLRIAVPEPQDDSIFASPWFWIPVGVVVAGGVAAAIIAASTSGRSSSTVTVSVVE